MEIQVKDFIKFEPSLNEALANPSSPEVRAQYLAENGLSTSTPYEQSYLSGFVPQITETPTTNLDSKRETIDEFNNRVLYPQLLKKAEEASKVYEDYKQKSNDVSGNTYRRKNYISTSIANSAQAKSIISEIKGMNISENDKDYLVKLANRESSFNPTAKNKYGYEGLYQFGDQALEAVGMTRQDLRSRTLNQHTAALRLAEGNERTLGNLASQYIGKEYKGVKVTKNGIRAAAHLLGAGTVQDWFRGTEKTKLAKKGFVDGNGTHITEYFRLFS